MKRMSLGSTARRFAEDFVDDDLMAQAAAIAYSATLAIAPLLVLMLAILGSLAPDARAAFGDAFAGLVGGGGKELVEQIASESARQPDWRRIGGWVSGALLIVGASAVFTQLQSALNDVWEIERPKGSGIVHLLRRRLFSIGLLLGLVFLTLMAEIAQFGLQHVPLPELGLAYTSWLLTTLAYVLLFSALYRWLPDGRLPWRTVARAGLLTALMFQLGHFLVVTYLTKAEPGAAFGAASALVIWLLWSFYSALIFLASAELVYAIAHARGWAWFAKPRASR